MLHIADVNIMYTVARKINIPQASREYIFQSVTVAIFLLKAEDKILAVSAFTIYV
jgi:hypothetical protein